MSVLVDILHDGVVYSPGLIIRIVRHLMDTLETTIPPTITPEVKYTSILAELVLL